MLTTFKPEVSTTSHGEGKSGTIHSPGGASKAEASLALVQTTCSTRELSFLDKQSFNSPFSASRMSVEVSASVEMMKIKVNIETGEFIVSVQRRNEF